MTNSNAKQLPQPDPAFKAINFFAVVVSAFGSLAAGFVWFTMIFPTPYLEGLGKTAEELAKGPSMLVASLLQLAGNFVMAYILAWLMARTGMQTVRQGMLLAALVWIGFVAAVLGPMYAFQAFSLEFFFITAGSVLVSLLIMGAILGGWK